MSLIGKKVKVYCKRTNKYIEGILLDKYSGLTTTRSSVPSGQGGTIIIDVTVNIDYYVIDMETYLLHTECSNLRGVNN